MRGARLVVVVLPALALVLGGTFACGTDPVGVESCRKIEQARCENAPACGISLTMPVHNGDSPEQDVAACIRYYHDACLHGFVAPDDPGAVVVQGCIDAINTGDCSVVKAPETSPSCSFLIPPAAPVTPVVDAATDATTD